MHRTSAASWSELVGLHHPVPQPLLDPNLCRNTPFLWKCAYLPIVHVVFFEWNQTGFLGNFLFISMVLYCARAKSDNIFISTAVQRMSVLTVRRVHWVYTYKKPFLDMLSISFISGPFSGSLSKGCCKRKQGSGFDNVSIWGISWPCSYLTPKDETQAPPLFLFGSLYWVHSSSFTSFSPGFPPCLVESWFQVESRKKGA